MRAHGRPRCVPSLGAVVHTPAGSPGGWWYTTPMATNADRSVQSSTRKLVQQYRWRFSVEQQTARKVAELLARLEQHGGLSPQDVERLRAQAEQTARDEIGSVDG